VVSSKEVRLTAQDFDEARNYYAPATFPTLVPNTWDHQQVIGDCTGFGTTRLPVVIPSDPLTPDQLAWLAAKERLFQVFSAFERRGVNASEVSVLGDLIDGLQGHYRSVRGVPWAEYFPGTADEGF
jgi:hypothetical protein